MDAAGRGFIVGVARDVGTGLWPVNGLRLPGVKGACGWYLCAGRGQMDQSPGYFEPVHVEHLYERCTDVLPYLRPPPRWRFFVAPGGAHLWQDPALPIS